MASAVAVEAQQPVSAQIVGNAFAQQYYHILHQSPGLVHRFYGDTSRLGRPERDGSMSITTTMQAIDKKIVSLNYGDLRAEIKSVDAQESFNGGVHVLVTGYLTGKDNVVNNFAQSFFLAPQEKGYFVLNDMFRYVDNVTVNPASVSDIVLPPATEPIPAPVQDNHAIQDNHVSEQSTPSEEEAIAGEVYCPPENGDVPIIEEEVPVAEVVDQEQDDEVRDSEPMVECSAKSNEVPKKSYASIVKHLKESAASFSPPPPVPRRPPPKSMEHVNPAMDPTPGEPFLNMDSVENEHNQEGPEADGYSIYIRGLPMNATESLLEEVFKKFGTIKNDGIQVRSNKQEVFCFGFVEFEEASSMQKALEASLIAVGGRQTFVEEKRSTNSRGNNRSARFRSGRGSGFRNDGVRGRGDYGGGRGYNGGDFNNSGEYGNRGGNRGPSNRNGYQRFENNTNNGGRVNRMPNGSAKNTTPEVSATS
ncbi:hypothetical protein OROHE_007312 [Orobanche hederae]